MWLNLRKIFTQISINVCQITTLSNIHIKKIAQGCNLAPIFGDLSQSEKLSEIKPHLEKKTQMHKNKNEPCEMISTHSSLRTYKSVLHWPVLWGNQPQLYSLQTKH